MGSSNSFSGDMGVASGGTSGDSRGKNLPDYYDEQIGRDAGGTLSPDRAFTWPVTLVNWEGEKKVSPNLELPLGWAWY